MDPRRRTILAACLAGMAQAALGRDLLRRPIPGTGKTLPLIGLGTWQVFDVGADPAARAQLREVLKLLDGNVVDSSPMYGTAESVVGDLVAELGMRERLFLATKVWTRGRDDGIRQMENSFRRLRVEQLDLMQVHNLVDVDTHAKTLQDMKAKGKLKYIGITHYTSSAYRELEREMKARSWDFVQINYSLAERESEERILPLAREKGMGVLINRPFGEGSLFRKTRNQPLPPWAAELGIATWAQYFLKWVVSHPAVTAAIPGTSKPAHMRDNLAAGEPPLPDEAQRRRMAGTFDAL